MRGMNRTLPGTIKSFKELTEDLLDKEVKASDVTSTREMAMALDSFVCEVRTRPYLERNLSIQCISSIKAVGILALQWSQANACRHDGIWLESCNVNLEW